MADEKWRARDSRAGALIETEDGRPVCGMYTGESVREIARRSVLVAAAPELLSEVIRLDRITQKLVQALQQAGPFGPHATNKAIRTIYGEEIDRDRTKRLIGRVHDG